MRKLIIISLCLFYVLLTSCANQNSIHNFDDAYMQGSKEQKIYYALQEGLFSNFEFTEISKDPIYYQKEENGTVYTFYLLNDNGCGELQKKIDDDTLQVTFQIDKIRTKLFNQGFSYWANTDFELEPIDMEDRDYLNRIKKIVSIDIINDIIIEYEAYIDMLFDDMYSYNLSK